MKLSIIIPVFNEEKTIKEIINKVETVSLPIEKEIIVIDDGSSDSTKDLLKQLKKQFNFILTEHHKNQGKGAAVKTGLSLATGDFVLIQDADLEYNPEDYSILLEPLLKREVEVVYGSRGILNNPYSYKIYLWGGRFLTFVFNLIFRTKLTDINTGYKVFAKKTLKDLNLKEKRFSFCEEITCKLIKKGYKIKEAPIRYTPREFKNGKKICWWRDGLKGLWVILKYRIWD